jgi:ComF family protein
MRLSSDIAAPLRPALRAVVDTVLPPRCLNCGVQIDDPGGGLCPDCWTAIAFIAAPQCPRCGVPFDFAVPGGGLCAGCAAHPPDFDRARAVFRYDDASRGLVLRYKHGDRTHATPVFARWLARAGAELLADAALLAPVPLHRWRLFMRRFNQAALLAVALAPPAPGPVLVPDLLQRVRSTPSQGQLGPSARARNVRGAFRLRRRHRDRVAGRRVLLVDDVITTGATAAECARTLKAAGASAVDVLALAQVVRPSHTA